jgi:carbon storage regulator
MLVLSRKKNQSLMIGENIEVHVMRIAGDRVSLGIIAPMEVTVLRNELVGKDRGDRSVPINSSPSTGP